MKSVYIPYVLDVDPETGHQVLSALDRHRNVLAMVSEAKVRSAEKELVKLLLHLLEAEAAKGNDRFGELLDAAPRKGSWVVLTPVQVVPIRLKLARAQANLRQADMAASLGITQQSYAKLERPGANPTLQTLAQLERVLGRDLLCWV
ncbi:MAG: helix-turn-helix transcriptional regulator [Holophaga sp.]|jgi:DNA-binding XRE family transcriptional regulator